MESFDSEYSTKSLEMTFASEEAADFWLSLGYPLHTPESFLQFKQQIAACRLAAEVHDTLKVWGVPLPLQWEKVISQTALQADGMPAWNAFDTIFPEVAVKLKEIWTEKQQLKRLYKVNNFTMQSSYFGPCEYRMLNGERGEAKKIPTIFMPGCLTGAISLENVSVAAAQLGHNIITCDTAAPSVAGNEKFHANNDTRNWMTERNAVNTAYTESVELSMMAYEEGYGMNEEETKIQKYNLVGYSTSAAAVLQAALRAPEKVENIALLCPIGTTNKFESQFANVVNILVNSIQHSMQNAELGTKNQNTREYFTGYLERQKIRGWSEVTRIIGNAAIADLTEAVYQVVVVHKIPVSVVVGKGDKLFPVKDSLSTLDRISGIVDKDGPEDFFNVHVLGEDYTHNHIGRDPELTARVLQEIFDQGTQKRIDRENPKTTPITNS